MRIVSPDFAKDFRCLAGECPDSCCRQGWQIDVDPEHRELYESMSGALGERVRAALTESGLRMTDGVCALLDEDGLCPIVKELGEEGLCRICRTHPRFLEQYGGVREVHFSLSCPEAARLALMRETPISFCEETTDEAVTEPNELDPDEYTALLALRDGAIRLMQQRRQSITDRLALLINAAEAFQRVLDRKRYGTARFVAARLRVEKIQRRTLRGLARLRDEGTSFLPDVALLRELETLTAEFPAALHDAVFTAKSGAEFDRENALAMEHMTVLWLAHYMPKAVNDGRVDTKLLLAAFLTLCTRRLCVCTGRSPAHVAGLLAKEIEHSEENVAHLCMALEAEGWSAHLIAQLDRRDDYAD
ncbi:MAG: flagellin lysine-N-methylase [Oscillospiraceae bacterium]|nr:flagellin lysine-N-methylase [Oscillospiraceae bacterium]